jgi:hypothetical protein
VTLLGLVLARAAAAADLCDVGIGLGAGVVACLVAMLAQHPLLDVIVGATFWIAVGLLAAMARPLVPQSRAAATAGWLAVGTVLLLLPLQVVRRAEASTLAGSVAGARFDRGTGDSGPYWTSRTGMAIYLSADALRCDLRLRARGATGDVAVSLRLNHHAAGTLSVGEDWRTFPLGIAARTAWPLSHHRLDLAWHGPPGGTVALDVARSGCQCASTGPAVADWGCRPR